MKNKFKWPLLAALAMTSAVALAADKYISSSGNIVLKTATSKSVNLQDTLYATQAGKVGIGLSTPAFPLHVRGVGGLGLSYSSSATGGATVSPASDYGGLRLATDSALPPSSAAFSFTTYNSGYSNVMTVLGNGNVGLGVDNPSEPLTIWKSLTKTLSSSGWGLQVLDAKTDGAVGNGGAISFGARRSDGGAFNAAAIAGSKQASGMTESGDMVFYTTSGGGALSEKMRLNNYGALLMQSPVSTGATEVYLRRPSNASQYLQMTMNENNVFYIMHTSGGMTLAQGATAWVAASDERLKENWTEISGALEKVQTLRAGTYNFKTDSKSLRHPGLIAQDLQKVLPEAVDHSDPNKLGVRYTEVIPLAIKAIQELKTQNDAMKGWICDQANAPEELCK